MFFWLRKEVDIFFENLITRFFALQVFYLLQEQKSVALINLNLQSCEKRLMTKTNAIKRLILFFIALIYVPESHKLLDPT